MQHSPKTGLRGLIENWPSDLLAAFSVSLVALPLALGVAIASGAPPMSGVLTAIIGGLVTTLFRGSHIGINGPAAGLIAVILASIHALDDGSGQALNYVLAAIVLSGAFQVLFGLLRWGRFGVMIHSTVIVGMLAAIGIIIIAKQIHLALGTSSQGSVFKNLQDVIVLLPEINPFVSLISIGSLLILVFYSRLNHRIVDFLPAPIWILVFSVALASWFQFSFDHQQGFFGKTYSLGPHLLVQIPDNILNAITYPNFSKMGTLAFWASVLSITLIASIETLAISKAVDKLDPYKRTTDLNKDLLGIGISNMVSGALGGLPIITVIVRSSVNIQNNAKTRWSNFYHGLLILIFIQLLSPYIQIIPLCALATLLVYTGFQLSSPKTIKKVYQQGPEQLVFFLGTIALTLATDILIGLLGGMILVLIVQVYLSRASPAQFFRLNFRAGFPLNEKQDGRWVLEIKGIANFLSTNRLDTILQKVPPKAALTVDCSKARLIDLQILEFLYTFQKEQEEQGGKVCIRGLEKHQSSSEHKLALKWRKEPV